MSASEDGDDLEALIFEHLSSRSVSETVLQQLREELEEPGNKRRRTSNWCEQSSRLQQLYEYSQNGTLQISVRTLSAREQFFTVSQSTRLSELMAIVGESFGIPIRQQSLALGSRVLRSNELRKKLSDLGVTPLNALFTLVHVHRPMVAICTTNGVLEFWDLIHGGCLQSFECPGRQEGAICACISPDNKMMICSHYHTGSLSQWTMEDGVHVASYAPHDNHINKLLVDWNTMRVLIATDAERIPRPFRARGRRAGTTSDVLKLWDLTSDRCVFTMQPDCHFETAAVDWSANRALTGSVTCVIQAWDLSTGARLQSYGVPCAYPAWILEFSWGTQRALTIADDGDGWMKLWDLENGQGLQWYPHPDPVEHVEVNWDAMVAVSLSTAGLRFWDLESNIPTLKIKLLDMRWMDVDWVKMRALAYGDHTCLVELNTGEITSLSAEVDFGSRRSLAGQRILQWPDHSEKQT